MRYLILWSFWVCLLWPPVSQGISHVGGGGKVLRNQETGFEGSLPEKLLKIQQLNPSTVYVRVLERALMGGLPMSFSSLYISDLHVENPNNNHFSKDQWIQWANENGWQIRDQRNCVLPFSQTSGQTTSWVLSWGQGRGLVLYAESTQEMNIIVAEFIQSIRILPGSCEWE